MLSNSRAGVGDNQSGNCWTSPIAPLCLLYLDTCKYSVFFQPLIMMIWNPLYLGKANDGGNITKRAKSGGIVIYTIVDEEPPESNLSGSVSHTETSRSQQAAGAAWAMFIIYADLGNCYLFRKPQLNKMAGRKTDFSLNNINLKYE